MADSLPPLPNIATQETVDKMMKAFEYRMFGAPNYGPHNSSIPPEKYKYYFSAGNYRTKEILDKIENKYKNFHLEEWFTENPREKVVNGTKLSIGEVIFGKTDISYKGYYNMAFELSKEIGTNSTWEKSNDLIQERMNELYNISVLDRYGYYNPDDYRPKLPYEVKGPLTETQFLRVSQCNGPNNKQVQTEMYKLLYDFLAIEGNSERIYKQVHKERWFAGFPETYYAALEYKKNLEEFSKDFSANLATIPNDVKVFLTKYLELRKENINDVSYLLYYASMGNTVFCFMDIYPCDFIIYDNDYRLNITSSYRDFHHEDWFNRNPSTMEEVNFFIAKTDEWISVLKDFKDNGNFADYSEGDIDREIIILGKRKKEVEKIKEILIARPVLYKPERWPEISCYQSRRNPVSEVQIYDPTQAKTTFSLRGKDLTPQSLIDAYKTLVSDKINVIFKHSRDWMFNEARRGVWDHFWYDWEDGVPKEPTKQANIDKIIKNLDYALDSDFGIMTAAPEVTVKQILSATNPDEPKAADYATNHIASMKNVMYALAENIRLLSRVRKHKQKIYFRSRNGTTTYYGEYEVYRILKPEYWSVEDVYKEFYRVGEDITEENIVKLFNDLYTKLVSIINGELDDPNPQGTDKDINGLETYFATGAMNIPESDITRGRM